MSCQWLCTFFVYEGFSYEKVFQHVLSGEIASDDVVFKIEFLIQIEKILSVGINDVNLIQPTEEID